MILFLKIYKYFKYLSMKSLFKKGFCWLTLALLSFASCKKAADSGTTSFYSTNIGSWGGAVTVSIDGVLKGTITKSSPSNISCNSSEVNVNASQGWHTLALSALNGQTFNGNTYVSGCSTRSVDDYFNLGPGGGGGGGCSYSLVGTWLRQNDGSCSGAAGMLVQYNGSIGVITSVGSNSCAFSVGDVKWQNFDSGNCSIDDLESSSSSQNYSNYGVSFSDANTVIIGSITYKRR